MSSINRSAIAEGITYSPDRVVHGGRLGHISAWLALLISSIGFAVAAGSQPAAASHYPHIYTYATEETGDGFTGVTSKREDRPVAYMEDDGCSQPFTGHPLYQTQWLIIGAPDSWREIGTVHQCSDVYRFWYWAYGYNGNFVPLGTRSNIPTCCEHTFSVLQTQVDQVKYYFYKIDGTIYGNLRSNLSGPRVHVGIESWDQAYLGPHTIQGMHYTRNGGSWLNFSGRDALAVDPGMCGEWVTDTSFQAAQSSVCP